jgi:hypothetical protein
MKRHTQIPTKDNRNPEKFFLEWKYPPDEVWRLKKLGAFRSVRYTPFAKNEIPLRKCLPQKETSRIRRFLFPLKEMTPWPTNP